MSQTVRNGTEFYIDLKANPQSGYLWYLGGVSPPHDVVLMEEEKEALENYKGCLQRFHFITKKVGIYTIHFVYKRVWEDIPLRTQEVIINVVE